MRAYPYPRHSRHTQTLGHIALLTLVLSLLFMGQANAKEKAPEKMIFLPFSVQTTVEEEYLQTGLATVFATRMAERTGHIAVHDHASSKNIAALVQGGGQDQEVKNILQRMQGSYLVLGSLREQDGQTYKLDIHILRAQQKNVHSFSRTVPLLERLIPALEELSIEIAEKVFQQPGQSAVSPVVQNTFQTAHPERLYRQGISSSASSPSPVHSGGTFSSQSSEQVSGTLRALALADVNGNGQKELLVLEQGNLALYRIQGASFQRLVNYSLPRHLALHTLHAADLSQGMEIFVSASHRERPASLILAWEGNSFRTVQDNIPYYLRPDSDALQRPILLGQAFSGTLYRLNRRQGQMETVEEIPVPYGMSLYHFIRVDLNKNGKREIVGLTQENKLVVLDHLGKLLWKSEDVYGAGRDFLGTPSAGNAGEGGRPRDRNRQYIPTRLLLHEQTADGVPELIIARNQVSTSRFFNRIRSFQGASVAALRWDGQKMHMVWETRELPGYIVDYQVLPHSKDPGRFLLFFGESEDSGGMFSIPILDKKRAYIHRYEMKQSEKMEAKP